MARIFQQVASCTPSVVPGTYVYDVKPAFQGSLAAITSDDHLFTLDRLTLRQTMRWQADDVPRGVRGLDSFEDGAVLVAAGRDGKVVYFDLRTQKPVHSFRSVKPVTALATSPTQVIIGTESSNRDAVVSVWDNRQLKEIWRNAENNDDITDVKFHPKISQNVLAGGDDGLVSIFDTTIAEEDDSLVQVINHGPIHKAGFLDEASIYALSSDQNLSVHAMSDPDNDLEEPQPSVFGDLRPIVPCEYVVDVVNTKTGSYVVAGATESNPHIDLIGIKGSYKNAQRLELDDSSRITLQGAHGEDIVRSIFLDEETNTIFTAGEDGQIKSFRTAEGASLVSNIAVKSSKSGKRNEARYRPY